MNENIKVSNGPIQAVYNAAEDTLIVDYVNKENSYADDNLKYPKTFKQLTLCTTSFGDPVEARIIGFKSDGWQFNRDLLVYVVISHFDETEGRAHALVESLFGSCKF